MGVSCLLFTAAHVRLCRGAHAPHGRTVHAPSGDRHMCRSNCIGCEDMDAIGAHGRTWLHA